LPGFCPFAYIHVRFSSLLAGGQNPSNPLSFSGHIKPLRLNALLF
jgi:hypothetical protein